MVSLFVIILIWVSKNNCYGTQPALDKQKVVAGVRCLSISVINRDGFCGRHQAEVLVFVPPTTVLCSVGFLVVLTFPSSSIASGIVVL